MVVIDGISILLCYPPGPHYSALSSSSSSSALHPSPRELPPPAGSRREGLSNSPAPEDGQSGAAGAHRQGETAASFPSSPVCFQTTAVCFHTCRTCSSFCRPPCSTAQLADRTSYCRRGSLCRSVTSPLAVSTAVLQPLVCNCLPPPAASCTLRGLRHLQPVSQREDAADQLGPRAAEGATAPETGNPRSCGTVRWWCLADVTLCVVVQSGHTNQRGGRSSLSAATQRALERRRETL